MTTYLPDVHFNDVFKIVVQIVIRLAWDDDFDRALERGVFHADFDLFETRFEAFDADLQLMGEGVEVDAVSLDFVGIVFGRFFFRFGGKEDTFVFVEILEAEVFEYEPEVRICCEGAQGAAYDDFDKGSDRAGDVEIATEALTFVDY